jgi:two-component system, NarL family, nitrate/nitrite response regulator NarL
LKCASQLQGQFKMSEQITVVVADDHSLFRTGVVQSLALDSAIRVVGEASSGTEALELVREHRPDLILLDISMPGDGIDKIRDLLQLPRPPRVVMLTVSQQDDDIVRSLEAGAVGYIVKGVTGADLIAAVRQIAAGESFVSPNLALRLVAGMKTKTHIATKLSDQEQRALRLVAMGMSNREVGDKLGISEKAVKYRMTRIMKKLNVKNRVEAVLVARQHWSNDPIGGRSDGDRT